MTDDIKHRRVWKDEVSKLQYANAVYIDRIATLETQNADLLASNNRISQEYQIFYHNVSRLFGSVDNFTQRGMTFSKQLEDDIRTVIQKYKDAKITEFKSKMETINER